jgi:transcriptional regulator
MYVPPAFAENDPAELRAIMQACSLPVLVSTLRDENGPRLAATHLPLLVDEDRLIGHLARANEHWRLCDPATDSLAIFKTVDGYVSPSFYPTKQETGRVVPTWDYEAVHASGPLEIIDSPERLLEIVTRLTDRYEAQRPRPWQVGDAPADYLASQLKGIVGVVLHIRHLTGVRKFGQNKSPADQEGVIKGLQAENPALANQMILASNGGK